jgi:hypothetical protein
MMNSVQQLVFLFGLVVTGFLLAGLVSWFRTRRYIDRSHKAIGVVIKVKKIPFQDKDTFSPVIRFTTSDGRALSFTDPVSKYPAEFELGEKTQVLYDPHNPHKARAVKRTSDLFILAKLFGVAGAAILAVGLVLGMVSWLMYYLPGFL